MSDEPDPPPEPEPGPRPEPEPDPQPAMPELQQVQLYLAGLRAQLALTDARRLTLEAAMDVVASVPLTGPTTH